MGAGRGQLSLYSLVKSLADNKQLLGMRYAEWCIAAPTLEADIAAAAMGLDDIGHSRVLYGSLRELGTPAAGADDGASYANVPFLDRPWTDWSEFVAANAVLDGAFTLMMEALANGNVDVLRTRLKKMLQEERYHTLHGRSWMQEVNAGAALEGAWRESLAWVGPENSDGDELHGAGRVADRVRDPRPPLQERPGRPGPPPAPGLGRGGTAPPGDPAGGDRPGAPR